MKVLLLAIPHVFAPKEGSLYSSQTEAKRSLKQEALLKATIGNLNQHRNGTGFMPRWGKPSR